MSAKMGLIFGVFAIAAVAFISFGGSDKVSAARIQAYCHEGSDVVVAFNNTHANHGDWKVNTSFEAGVCESGIEIPQLTGEIPGSYIVVCENFGTDEQGWYLKSVYGQINLDPNESRITTLTQFANCQSEN